MCTYFFSEVLSRMILPISLGQEKANQILYYEITIKPGILPIPAAIMFMPGKHK